MERLSYGLRLYTTEPVLFLVAVGLPCLHPVVPEVQVGILYKVAAGSGDSGGTVIRAIRRFGRYSDSGSTVIWAVQ